MATTQKQIASYLDLRGWHYEPDTENQCIYTGVKTKNLENLVIVIKLTENGEFLQLQAPEILSLNDHVYKGPTLQTLASIQYQVKMLRLEYDPRDGEIHASIELPLEDATLTQRQFDRALSGLIQLVDHHALPRLRQTLATGIDPGPPSLAQQMLHALPPDFITALAQALQQQPPSS